MVYIITTFNDTLRQDQERPLFLELIDFYHAYGAIYTEVELTAKIIYRERNLISIF